MYTGKRHPLRFSGFYSSPCGRCNHNNQSDKEHDYNENGYMAVCLTVQEPFSTLLLTGFLHESGNNHQPGLPLIVTMIIVLNPNRH